MYARRQKTSTPRTLRCWWKKLKMTQTEGKIYHVLDWKNRHGQDDSTSLGNLQIQCNSLKLPKSFFKELEFFFLICMETQNRQSNPRHGGNGTGIRLPDFRLYYKAIAIKKVWCWHKNRNIDQWKRIESSEINPCTYGQLTYNKGGKNRQWRKDSLLNKWYWETGQLHVKEWN